LIFVSVVRPLKLNVSFSPGNKLEEKLRSFSHFRFMFCIWCGLYNSIHILFSK